MAWCYHAMNRSRGRARLRLCESTPSTTRPAQCYRRIFGIFFKEALPASNEKFCVLKPSAQTHTAAPHCGSHCHQLPVVLTLHVVWQASAGALLMDLMAATADSLRVRLTEDAAELASADRVLVVLSSGALGCSIRGGVLRWRALQNNNTCMT